MFCDETTFTVAVKYVGKYILKNKVDFVYF